MSLHYVDDWLTVYHGDCREVMAGMEPESVHCVVTSPPYWGLRDYGETGQLGLEPTPEEYVANLVAVFREVRRVLRADGTVWLNLGDSYNNADKWGGGGANTGKHTREPDGTPASWKAVRRRWEHLPGLKPKDLVGIPWRVAFALQADGWYLRSDIIWSKPNPMPESVTDRPTKSHEYIFLLSRSPRYYFDADAVREPDAGTDHWRGKVEPIPSAVPNSGAHHGIRTVDGRNGTGRNIRSVWTMATQPYPGAHFATFPETLPERCIKAGTSEKGVCPECGAPWERVVERERVATLGEIGGTPKGEAYKREGLHTDSSTIGRSKPWTADDGRSTTLGWRSVCRCCVIGSTHPGLECQPFEPVPATVLDPFAGSGTTGMVAQSLSRRAVLIDLSLDYLAQLMARNADIPLGLGA